MQVLDGFQTYSIYYYLLMKFRELIHQIWSLLAHLFSRQTHRSSLLRQDVWYFALQEVLQLVLQVLSFLVIALLERDFSQLKFPFHQMSIAIAKYYYRYSLPIKAFITWVSLMLLLASFETLSRCGLLWSYGVFLDRMVWVSTFFCLTSLIVPMKIRGEQVINFLQPSNWCC